MTTMTKNNYKLLTALQRDLIEAARRGVPAGARDRFEKHVDDALHALLPPLRDTDVSRIAYDAAQYAVAFNREWAS